MKTNCVRCNPEKQHMCSQALYLYANWNALNRLTFTDGFPKLTQATRDKIYEEVYAAKGKYMEHTYGEPSEE